MNTHTDKIQKDESKAVANTLARQQESNMAAFWFTDNRPEAIMQRKLQALANTSIQATQLKSLTTIQQDNTIQKQSDLEEEKPVQGKFKTIQRASLEEEEPVQGKFETAQLVEKKELLQGKFESIQRVASEEDELLQGKFEQSSSAIQLQAADSVIQRVTIAGIDVILSGSMPQWDQDGLTYHLNLTTDPPHVTCENWPKKKGTTKMQFFYKGSGSEITNAVSGQRGKLKFSDLPGSVQTFVKNNYTAILKVK